MKKPVRPRWRALTAGALAVSCSSTPPTVQETAPHAQPRPAAVAIDTSAVPAPGTLVALVRFRSARGFAQRLGEKLGLRELVRGFTEQLPSALGDDEVLARAIDLDAPADVLIYQRSHAHLHAVFSFGAQPMPAAEDALTHGHRLTPVAPASSGVRRIERVAENADDAEGPVSCVLAPAGGDDPRAARIVCAERYDQIAEAQPYLTRTLPRTPLAADAGDLVLDLAAEQLRAQFADDLREAADGIPESVTPAPDPNNPELQTQVRTWAREYLAATLTQGLQDLGAARLSVRFTDAGATLRGDLAVRALSAPLVRDIVASTRDAHPSVDVLNKLPPGGSVYVASAGTMEPFRASMALAGAVAMRLLVPHATLPPADATALRTALVNFASGGGYNRFQSASTMGTSAAPAARPGVPARPGAPAAAPTEWHLNVYQLDAPATPLVTNFRAAVAALRRPAVARAVNAEWHVNPATLRTPPTPGLPAGSLFVQVPLPATLPASMRMALNVGNTYEMLAVPDGNTLWLAYGANVLARYREARAAHAAPPPIEGMSGDDVVLAASMLPGGLARALSRIDPQIGRVLERGFANVATTPMLGYVRSRPQGDGAVMSFDLTVPDGILGAIGGTLRQGNAPSATP